MMLRSRGLLLAAFAAAFSLAVTRPAEAAFGDFTYTVVLAPTGTIAPTTPTTGNVSSLALNPVNSTASINAAVAGGTDVSTATLVLSKTGLASSGSDSYSIPVTEKITVTDVTSGVSHTFTFTGTLIGTVTETNTGVFSSNFSNPLFAPTPQIFDYGQTGGLFYTVTADPTKDFVPPGAPSSTPGSAGGFSLNVSATHVQSVPEPASMTLLFLGSIGAIGAFRRRKAQV